MPGQTVIALQAELDTGAFLVGVRPALAPKSAALVLDLVESGAFLGQKLSFETPGFLVLPTQEKVKKSTAPLGGESNRVGKAPGLLYFDGRSRLGIAISHEPIPKGWICIGQVQIPGQLAEMWSKIPSQPEAAFGIVRYLGNLKS